MLLLTNDDGIDSPGLQALWDSTSALGLERIVVAPSSPISNCGHAVTTREPIRFEYVRPGWIAVCGTPADCVRLAIRVLVQRTSIVLSGINAGGNLGSDVHHSGTVAAAREASLHGLPAIAISHYRARGRDLDWSRASRWTARVLDELIQQKHPPRSFWNVNLPHPESPSEEPALTVCQLDPSPLPLEFEVEGNRARYNGTYQNRARLPGHDVDVCFGDAIAATLLFLP